MKKFVSTLLIATLVTTMLSSCSPSQSINKDDKQGEATQNAKSIEFEVAITSSEAERIEVFEKMYTSFINDFNKENNTNYVLKLSSGQTKDILNTRMTSIDKPDVFSLDSPADAAVYQKEGLLLDLTTYANEYKWEDKLFDWAYKLSMIDNKVYSLPYGYEGMVIWYNKNIMNELGIDPSSLGSLESFESALERASSNGYTPIMLGAQDWPWAQEWYLSIFYSYAGRDLLKSTLQGDNEKGWESEEYYEAVELYKSWHDKGYLADGKSYVLTSDDAINAFSSDKALFKLEGTWAPYWITPLEQEDQDKIGVMLHPPINKYERPHMPIAVGSMWGASAETKHPEISGYFINRLLDEDIQSEFLKIGGDLAPIPLDESIFSDLQATTGHMWKMVNDALANGDYGYTTWAFYPPETRVYLYEGIVNVFEETITIEDYLKEMNKLNKKELESGFVPILP